MNAFLRNLAGIWADNRFIKANDVLRRQIRQARIERDEARRRRGGRVRAMRDLIKANRTLVQVAAGFDHMRQEAERERDEANAYALQLEQAAVAQSGKGWDEAWADAAGVAGPEVRQP